MASGVSKVLVSMPEESERTSIAQSLGAVGIEVKIARDGGRALEVAVLEHPDLVVFDVESGALDASRFCEILRGNPRTEAIPVLVIAQEARGPGGFGINATLVTRPFTIDALAQRVREMLRSRTAAAKVAETGGAAGAAASMVQGNLAEIALVDLLQIFVMNRKEGRLLLKGEAGSAPSAREGEIHLKAGSIVHARAGATEGTKALYRLLAWRRGRFSYQPGATSPVRTIKSTPDAVVMEGMRQSDELERLADRRPPDRARVVVTMDRKGLPEDLHRTTREVLSLTEFYGTVGEIVERATSTDFEVLRALILLEEKGVLYFDRSGVEPTAEVQALVDAERLAGLRARTGAATVPGAPVTWKVVLLTRDRASLRRFLTPFSRVPGFEANSAFFDPAAAKRPPIGVTARLSLAEGHQVELVTCPTLETYRPLLGLFGERTLAAVVIHDGDDPGLAALAAQVREALGAEAIPLDLAVFSPEVAPPSDGSSARALIDRIVDGALEPRRTAAAESGGNG